MQKAAHDLKNQGDDSETNEHADRFNQGSPSGQLPLLAKYSRSELPSQTHHSMSKVPRNMSPCHGECGTLYGGNGGDRRQALDKATWSALQIRQAGRVSVVVGEKKKRKNKL